MDKVFSIPFYGHIWCILPGNKWRVKALPFITATTGNQMKSEAHVTSNTKRSTQSPYPSSSSTKSMVKKSSTYSEGPVYSTASMLISQKYTCNNLHRYLDNVPSVVFWCSPAVGKTPPSAGTRFRTCCRLNHKPEIYKRTTAPSSSF